MLKPEQAKTIMDDVRRRFATGAKSANKAYLDDGGDLPSIEDDEEIRTTGDKKAIRNHNAAYASIRIDALRADSSELSILRYGKVIWEQSVRYGNCTEMACVAAYRVDEAYRGTPISLGATSTSGDHVFCIVGEIGAWDRIGKPPAGSGAIVIDPWANVCCVLPAYPDTFGKKMEKWLSEGKRIFGGGSTWLAPDKKYFDRFRASKVDIINAKSSISALIG